MSNSPLVAYTKISPNKNVGRKSAIDRITPHCIVGQMSAESLGDWFYKSSTQASSNYGIDKNARVGMYVEEKDRSWCSSSSANDNRAVTIECASDTKSPFTMKNEVYLKLIELCVDICKRNGKTKLLWIPDKNKALNYTLASNEMLLTVHCWFADKDCPGNWLYSRLGDLAEKVTSKLNNTVKEEDSDIMYTIAFKDKSQAEAFLAKVKADGFNASIVAVSGNTSTAVTSTEAKITVGSRVRVKSGAKTYTGGKIASFVYDNVYTVDELKGERAVLDKKGIYTPFNVNDLILQ